MPKQTLLIITFFLFSNFSFSQIFISENGGLINFNKKEADLKIDNTTYSGNFQSFNSKKDKKEYLLYSYFSRTVIFTIDRPLNEIDQNITNLNLTIVRLIHSNKINSIMEKVNKKGIKNLKDFIVVYQSDKSIPLIKFKQ